MIDQNIFCLPFLALLNVRDAAAAIAVLDCSALILVAQPRCHIPVGVKEGQLSAMSAFISGIIPYSTRMGTIPQGAGLAVAAMQSVTRVCQAQLRAQTVGLVKNGAVHLTGAQ